LRRSFGWIVACVISPANDPNSCIIVNNGFNAIAEVFVRCRSVFPQEGRGAYQKWPCHRERENRNRVEPNHDLIYIALNKPKGYIASCTRDRDEENIVLDLIDVHQRIYPVGRLDKDTTGLLILTNDGKLHHRLSHPSFDHEKEYEVTVDRPVGDGALRKLAQGVPMMGTKTRPARIKRRSARRFRITLQEGKNRQVRRMVRKIGGRVSKLKRVRVADIKLGKLAEGNWRYLTEKEKTDLLGSKI
jgi:23S rRNA pseudouridine2605 synthase/23S rRNA pseudouridine2604 synthase